MRIIEVSYAVRKKSEDIMTSHKFAEIPNPARNGPQSCAQELFIPKVQPEMKLKSPLNECCFPIAIYPRKSPSFTISGGHEPPNFKHHLDIVTPVDTPVYAAEEGIVFAVETGHERQGGFGNEYEVPNCVFIYHPKYKIDGENTCTLYAHLKDNIQVKMLDTVERGQLVGYTGYSGNMNIEHLHFGAARISDGVVADSILTNLNLLIKG